MKNSGLDLDHDTILDVVNEPLALGKAIRIARKAAGMTQEEAGERLGLARTTIVAMELGYRNVRASDLQELAVLYGCDIAQFYEQQEQELPAQPVLSARKRVMKRVLKREPDPTMQATLQTLVVSQREMERMAATLLVILIEMEARCEHE